MSRTPDISNEGQKAVRAAIKSGGPLPFVPTDLQRGDSQRPLEGNPLKQRRMRPVKADVNVLLRILNGARRRSSSPRS